MRCGAVGRVRGRLWSYVRAHGSDYVWGPVVRARRFHDVISVEEHGESTRFVVSARFLLERVAPLLRNYDSTHNEAPPFRWLVRYAAFRPTALFGGYAEVTEYRDLVCELSLYSVYVPIRHVGEDLPWLYARQTMWVEDGRRLTAQEACRRGLSKTACEALARCWNCEWEGEVELFGAKYYLVEWD